MSLYECLRTLKFLSVMGFAGGAIAALVSTEPTARRRAAHVVASPCLLAVWLTGWWLSSLRGWSFSELWIVAALALSLVANGALSYVVARERRGVGPLLGVATPIVAIVLLMVIKPRWEQLR